MAPQYTNFQTMTAAESIVLVTNVPSKAVCFMYPLGLGHSVFFLVIMHLLQCYYLQKIF